MKKGIFALFLLSSSFLGVIYLESADGKDKQAPQGPQGHQAPPHPTPQARPAQPHAVPQPRAAQPHAAPQAHPTPQGHRAQPHPAPQVRSAQPRAAPQVHSQSQAAPQAHQARTPAAQQMPRTQRVINNYSRTPSLSRIGRGPTQSPKTIPSTRETTPQQAKQIDSQRFTKPERSALREQAKQYIQRVKEARAQTPAKAHEVPKTFQGTRERNPERSQNIDRGGRREQDREGARRVREHFRRDHPDHSDWFTNRFFDRYHYYPYYYDQGYDWWSPMGWNNIIVWLSWNNVEPIYYDVGGYPIVQPIEVVPTQEPVVEGNWLPLGVFVVGKDVDKASLSNLFIQLAIDKDGDLAGTYYNASTDQVYQLEGAVDNETQQAVWKLTEDPNSPLMMTGLYNLTQDIAPVQMQFSDGTEESWVMVRLNE